MENADIAKIFYEIADLLEIKGESRFRIISYRNAAQVIEALPVSLESIVERDERELEKIRGIGKSIHEKIVEIIKTKKCRLHDELLKEVPSGLLGMLTVSGLGPKKVKMIFEHTGISSLDELEKAATKGALRALPGMGEKSERNILKAIKTLRKGAGLFGIAYANALADEIAAYLKDNNSVLDAVPAGSVRRSKETVGDIDILVACKESGNVMKRFAAYHDAERVLSRGKTKSSIILGSGIQVDLRAIDVKSFGAALLYFTGSKSHNVALRDRAKKMGFKISEYGVFKESGNKWVAGKSEEEVYRAIGLAWIPPELRENRGEIEAAEKASLPKLVSLEDIRGDLHLHTTESDGKNTILELAESAIARGYGYIAVTDHSKAVGIAHGLDEKRLLRQIDEIELFNEKQRASGSSFRVLKGSEVDIRMDGSLDLDGKVLKKLDIVVGSVHSGFSMPENRMTDRIIAAISSGLVNIIGHPTGRLISRREPYSVDMAKIMRAAKKHNVAMEINSYPERLDLNDVHARLARDIGVKVVISTDSHNIAQMENMRYGVANARRAWLEKKDVLNTLPADKLIKFLG